MLRKLIPSRRQGSRRFEPPVRHRSAYENVYHCTVQKCASQWINAILADEKTYQYCGLTPCGPAHRAAGTAFPSRTIVSPLYVHFDDFVRIPKPAHYRAFFVMRDPRDVVTSWYFSVKYSHPLSTAIEPVRQELNRLSEADGFLHAIEFLDQYGLFEAQRSWAGAAAADANVMLVRFEDLIAQDQVHAMQQVLNHCDIAMPPQALVEVLMRHSFERLSGRRPGVEDRAAHYRKGVAGDWRSYFDEHIHARFSRVAGHVLTLWGYA